MGWYRPTVSSVDLHFNGSIGKELQIQSEIMQMKKEAKKEHQTPTSNENSSVGTVIHTAKNKFNRMLHACRDFQILVNSESVLRVKLYRRPRSAD